MKRRRGLIRRAASFTKKLFSNVAFKAAVFFGHGYNALDPNRKLIEGLVGAFGLNRQTANEILEGSHVGLTAFGRHLERNNATARAGIEGLVACVVGTGIGLEPLDVAEVIKEEWKRYVERCGVDGCSAAEMQRRSFRDVVPAGESIWRFIIDPSLLDRGEIPVRVLCLESEWVVDHAPESEDGTTTVMGVDFNRFGVMQALWIANPDNDEIMERVPAEDISLIFERRRCMQARGESWFAPIIETLLNERDLVDVELYAAKQCAGMAIAITSDFPDEPDTKVHGTPADPVVNMKIGSTVRLLPGEKAEALSHDRPAQEIKPFRDMLRGDTAGAMRLAKRFFDRDITGANYSSMRADDIDQEKLLRPVRDWFGNQTIGRLYAFVLPFIALKHGRKIPAVRYRLLPDKRAYVDPVKDATGAKIAIENDLSTLELEASGRGLDYRDNIEKNAEVKLARGIADIATIQKLQEAANKANAETEGLDLTWQQLAAIGGADTSPSAFLAASTKANANQPQPANTGGDDDDE